MKPVDVGVLVLACSCLFLSSSVTAADPTEPQLRRAPYVTPATVKAWLTAEQSVVFLDVREADEFAAGHLPGAINIHYDQIASRADQLPHEHPIVIYCIHSAHRAPEAAKSLQALGFDNVSVLEGGIVAWQADGLTIQTSDLARAPTILPKTERCQTYATP